MALPIPVAARNRFQKKPHELNAKEAKQFGIYVPEGNTVQLKPKRAERINKIDLMPRHHLDVLDNVHKEMIRQIDMRILNAVPDEFLVVGRDSLRPERELAALVSSLRPVPTTGQDKAGMLALGVYVDGVFKNRPKYYKDTRYLRLAPDQEKQRIYCWKTNRDVPGREDIRRAVEDYGYKSLGSGHYSVVTECPWDNTKVLKIGMGPSWGGSYLRDGWLSWAAFCMAMKQQRDYPNLPNIYSIMFFDNCFIAIMEKLDGTWHRVMDSPEYRRHDTQLTSQRDHLMYHYRNGWRPEEPLEHICGMPLDIAFEWTKHPLMPKADDLHGDNYMVDLKRGRVVITDPSSNEYTLKEGKKDIFRALGLMP